VATESSPAPWGGPFCQHWGVRVGPMVLGSLDFGGTQSKQGDEEEKTGFLALGEGVGGGAASRLNLRRTGVD